VQASGLQEVALTLAVKLLKQDKPVVHCAGLRSTTGSNLGAAQQTLQLAVQLAAQVSHQEQHLVTACDAVLGLLLLGGLVPDTTLLQLVSHSQHTSTDLQVAGQKAKGSKKRNRGGVEEAAWQLMLACTRNPRTASISILQQAIYRLPALAIPVAKAVVLAVQAESAGEQVQQDAAVQGAARRRLLAQLLPLAHACMATVTLAKAGLAESDHVMSELCELYRTPLLAYLQRKRKKQQAAGSSQQDPSEDDLQVAAALHAHAVPVLLSCLQYNPLSGNTSGNTPASTKGAFTSDEQTQLWSRIVPPLSSSGAPTAWPVEDARAQPAALPGEQARVAMYLLQQVEACQ
jgi:hypothetical protein